MRNLLIIFLILVSIVSCSSKNAVPLIDRVDSFNISECRKNCSIDSIGIRHNKIEESKLKLKFGYILNCSWEVNGYLKDLRINNDTLFVNIDQKPEETRIEIDSIQEGSETIITEREVMIFPYYDCDCFLNFDIVIDGIEKAPNEVKIFSAFDKIYLDEIPKKRFRYYKSIIE